jgi:hypothetical protein
MVRMRRFDVITVLLLLIGGIVIPVVGWIAGAVMLVRSHRWRVRDKLLGLLVWPGGLALPAAMEVSTLSGPCGLLARPSGPPHQSPDTTTFVVADCHMGPTWHDVPLVMLPLIAGPIAIAAYLLGRTRLVDPGPGR